ncbi:hypothetical protein IGB42_04225 [Andreprevotia sp. IGB-42]|nr:hypothetical protein IGB42_04225 [Andreprevotia sp. IGB-42]
MAIYAQIASSIAIVVVAEKTTLFNCIPTIPAPIDSYDIAAWGECLHENQARIPPHLVICNRRGIPDDLVKVGIVGVG